MNINLNLYKYFYSVAKNCSYTKAAEELMISQPSLSYSVKVLEEQLGKKLFERMTKGIELTREGEELYKRIAPIIENLDSICYEENNMSGTIIIGSRPFHTQKMLPPKLRLIHLLYPEINIEIKLRKNSNELHTLLKNKEVDIILDEMELDTLEEKSEKIKLDQNIYTCFFTSTNRNIDIVNQEIIDNEKILSVESNRFSVDLLGIYPQAKIEPIASTPDMIEEVKINNRIGISANTIIEDYIKLGKIKILKCEKDFPENRINYYISYNKKNYSKKLEKIVEILKDYDINDAEEALKNNN